MPTILLLRDVGVHLKKGQVRRLPQGTIQQLVAETGDSSFYHVIRGRDVPLRLRPGPIPEELEATA